MTAFVAQNECLLAPGRCRPDLSPHRITVESMGSRKGNRPDNEGSVLFAILVVIAVLWWLRWIILAGLVISGAVLGTRWLLRRRAQWRTAENARADALRRRAELENVQVLRGDPHGFFGQYPLPDPELIPRWYKAG